MPYSRQPTLELMLDEVLEKISEREIEDATRLLLVVLEKFRASRDTGRDNPDLLREFVITSAVCAALRPIRGRRESDPDSIQLFCEAMRVLRKNRKEV
jgi:hypothetical protein